MIRRLLIASLFAVVTLPAVRATAEGPDPKEVQAVVDKAVDYLRKSQSADGSYSARRTGPGVTALVAAGLLRNGRGPDDPVVAKSLAYLEKSVKPDGGVYDRGLANYTTSVALMTFKEANTGGKYDTILKNAVTFLKGLQYAKGNADAKDAAYGGLSYGKEGRPDLSNTQYFLDAMQTAGVARDDPAVQRALKFVSRCQNLPGETNDQPFAKKTTDDDRGGLTYTPIDADDSPHKTPEGGLRSLGAMTYGGLKSFLYAGVNKDDPRVQGAIRWIRSHYTLDENTGMGQAGLFYYYHTFGKAMQALGEDHFEDAKGVKHDWRSELFDALRKRQREDGSFVNAGDRTFGEADPNLSTAFALLTLSYCKAPAK
jgi:squalene-hopene/tetraprenyl-beta-curcumene cyclase